MTIEQKLYGPPWVICAVCGVTQPLGRVQLVEKAFQCTHTAKCAEGKLERERELAKFKQANVVLTARKDR